MEGKVSPGYKRNAKVRSSRSFLLEILVFCFFSESLLGSGSNSLGFSCPIFTHDIELMLTHWCVCLFSAAPRKPTVMHAPCLEVDKVIFILQYMMTPCVQTKQLSSWACWFYMLSPCLTWAPQQKCTLSQATWRPETFTEILSVPKYYNFFILFPGYTSGDSSRRFQTQETHAGFGNNM